MVIDVDEDVQLDAEVLGDADAPAMLLIGGAGWSRDWWDDDLCALLVARGWRVIRYDARDTGASTSWPAGEPGYTGMDLVSDALAVLDALGVGRAHVVGLSAGAGVAQYLTLAHRERVGALTLLATTAVDPSVGDLPGPTPAIAALFADEGPGPDWNDRDAAVTALVEGERAFAGAGVFEEARVRAIANRVVARSRDLAASTTNPIIAAASPTTGPTALSALAGLPTLVVHGGADPLFPPEHGRALGAAIPGARLLEIADMGHQLPPVASWDRLVDALPAHPDTSTEDSSMAKLIYSATASLDGFIAGPGGDMSWLTEHIGGENPTADRVLARTGAILAGRVTFGGDDPNAGTDAEGAFGGQYDGPVVVLTHRPPEEPPAGVEFATDLGAAVGRAKTLAGDRDVNILGADVAAQCVDAGLLDEVLMFFAPVLLGDGTPIFRRPGGTQVRLERLPGETEHWYRVVG